MCSTCRLLRRLIVALLVAGFSLWQSLAPLPRAGGDPGLWRGVFCAALAVAVLNLVLSRRHLWAPRRD